MRKILVLKITGAVDNGKIEGLCDRRDNTGNPIEGYGKFHRHMIGFVRPIEARAPVIGGASQAELDGIRVNEHSVEAEHEVAAGDVADQDQL